MLLAVEAPDALATPPAPGGHLPLTYGGSNQQPYPALTPLDVPFPSDQPAVALRIGVVPNPFAGTTTIQLTLAPGRTGVVEIFDLAGRLIRRFSAKTGAQPGTRVVWDGRNRAGGTVPSGVYLVRATAAGEVRSTRLVLLR